MRASRLKNLHQGLKAIELIQIPENMKGDKIVNNKTLALNMMKIILKSLDNI
jgi:hypothetical protein